MKTYISVVECQNHEICYGILVIDGIISVTEVQDKIYEIKNKFYNEEYCSWCIDDIFEQFPEEWNWKFIPGNGVVEI